LCLMVLGSVSSVHILAPSNSNSILIAECKKYSLVKMVVFVYHGTSDSDISYQ
jgi:hypothetical protein